MTDTGPATAGGWKQKLVRRCPKCDWSVEHRVSMSGNESVPDDYCPRDGWRLLDAIPSPSEAT